MTVLILLLIIISVLTIWNTIRINKLENLDTFIQDICDTLEQTKK